MPHLAFNKKLFLRTITIFLAISTIWTVLCFLTNEFTDTDKGFVSGLGFLIVFSTSIYLGQKVKGLTSLGSLILLTILTFAIGSYGLGLIFINSNSILPYTITNSLFVSIVMTIFLNSDIGIEFKLMTVTLTFLLVLLSYYLNSKISDKLYMEYDFHPRLTLFNVFQLFLIWPLTLGMTLKRHSHA